MFQFVVSVPLQAKVGVRVQNVLKAFFGIRVHCAEFVATESFAAPPDSFVGKKGWSPGGEFHQKGDEQKYRSPQHHNRRAESEVKNSLQRSVTDRVGGRVRAKPMS